MPYDDAFAPPESRDPSPRDTGDFVDIPASAGARFVAYFIDSLAALALMAPLLFAAGYAAVELGDEQFEQLIDAGAQLFGLCIVFIYNTGLEASRWRATPGKLLMGIQISALSGHDDDLDLGKVAARNLGKSIGLSFCGLLALTVLSEEGKSMWDNMAGTRVIKRQYLPG
jgi:uncharacterized RDD family membrane protein YckC